MALDDPEGWDLYREIQSEAAADHSIKLFTNLTGVGNIEVNAFQRLSSVVLQKSIREGFGLVVSESLWKGTPVVAGRAGGIPLQMADGTGGILVDSTEATAKAMIELLGDHERADALGRTGRERVHEHFLLPRLLLNELALLNQIAGGDGLRIVMRPDVRARARSRRRRAGDRGGRRPLLLLLRGLPPSVRDPAPSGTASGRSRLAASE